MSDPPDPGKSANEASAERLAGAVLADRYRIDRLVGEGGMGRVYCAEHVAMRKRVAIKVLHRQLGQVPDIVARFEREAMAAANIDHPNVAAATDFGKLDDGSIFLVLEYVEGRSLRDEIDKGPVPYERALKMGRQIASALASAHALKIVHRDLKPENIMLVDKPEEPDFVKVLDFGIARVPMPQASENAATDASTVNADKPITKVGMVFGTAEYMPPEQALGQPVDGRADIYSLGVILYELVSGRRPFSGKTQVEVLGQQLQKPPPSLADVAPDSLTPPTVEQFIQHLLSKDVGQRPETAEAVVAAIDAMIGSPRSAMGSRPGSLSDVASYPDGEVGSWPGGRPRMPTGSVPDGRLPSQGSIPDVLQPGVVRASVRDGSIADGRVSGGHRAHSTGVGAWVARLPAPLSSIPPVGWMVALAVVVLGGLGAVLMGVVSASGPEGADEVTASDGTTVPANPDAELALELARAKADGVEALEVLTKKHPKDTKILIELAKAHELGKDEVAAVAAIGRALAIDTDVRKNPKAGKLLWRAAIGKKARDAAFDLLEGPMLEAGADIIYDLVITPGLEQKVLTRAEKFLASKSFQSNSSPALNVVIGLRSAKQCAQMHGLLLRAKNVGDKRALKYLRRYENRMGCGRNGARDCFPCMRADDRLSEAIRAIEKREKG